MLPAPASPRAEHEADRAALRERIEDRHVVDRDHAEGRLDAALLEEGGDDGADRDGVVGRYAWRERPPEMSMWLPVV